MSNLNEILSDIEDFFIKRNIEIQMIDNQVKIYHHDNDYILLIIGDDIEAHSIDENNCEMKLSFNEIEDFFSSFEDLFFRSHLRKK